MDVLEKKKGPMLPAKKAKRRAKTPKKAELPVSVEKVILKKEIPACVEEKDWQTTGVDLKADEYIPYIQFRVEKGWYSPRPEDSFSDSLHTFFVSYWFMLPPGEKTIFLGCSDGEFHWKFFLVLERYPVPVEQLREMQTRYKKSVGVIAKVECNSKGWKLPSCTSPCVEALAGDDPETFLAWNKWKDGRSKTLLSDLDSDPGAVILLGTQGAFLSEKSRFSVLIETWLRHCRKSSHE